MPAIFGTRGGALFLKGIAIFFLFFPLYSYASVSITEIMYNPAGSDAGHEWIEIYNDGTPVDISKWKLFEGDSNHGIAAYVGTSTLGASTYAILADNPSKFLADFPGFSGQVFNTAFSGGLNNKNGETLVLKNDTLAPVDTVTYNPALGGNGDGSSLQKNGTSWVAALPTPGSAFVLKNVVTPPSASSASPVKSTPSSAQTAKTNKSVASDGYTKTQNMLAAPAAAVPAAEAAPMTLASILPWVMALLALIGILVAAVLLTAPKKSSTAGYTIIEEEE